VFLLSAIRDCMLTPYRVCHIISHICFCMSFGYTWLSRLGLQPHALPALGKDAFVLLQGWPSVVPESGHSIGTFGNIRTHASTPLKTLLLRGSSYSQRPEKSGQKGKPTNKAARTASCKFLFDFLRHGHATVSPTFGHPLNPDGTLLSYDDDDVDSVFSTRHTPTELSAWELYSPTQTLTQHSNHSLTLIHSHSFFTLHIHLYITVCKHGTVWFRVITNLSTPLARNSESFKVNFVLKCFF